MTNTSKQRPPSRQPKFPDTTILRVLKPNPHREGTIDHADFAAIKDGGTVGDALKNGSKRSYINYAIRQGLVAVGGAEQPKPKRGRKPRTAAATRRPRRSAGAEVRAAI